MKKKFFTISDISALSSALILAMIISLSACSRQNSPISKSCFAFDTFINLTVYECDGNTEAVLDKAVLQIKELETDFSCKLSDNEIAKVNNSAYNQEVVISDLLFELIEKSVYVSEITDGAFDFTLGKLSDLWGFGTDNAVLPDKKDIEKYINKNNWKNVRLNKENSSVKFLNKDIKLDFGGIAKGFAGGKVRDFLIENKVTSAILDFGGNIITIGQKDNDYWKVGIPSPSNEQEILMTVEINQSSAATSSGMKRFIEVDGKKYHHILDPKTGYPAETEVASMTIVCEDCGLADGLSTACFIMGWEKAAALVEKLSDVDCIAVYSDNSTSSTCQLLD